METILKEIIKVTAPVRMAVIGVLAVLALFLFVQIASTVQQMSTYSVNTITVNGQGTATAVPDTATVSFSASATAANVAAAQSNVTTIVNDAVASLKSSGIAAADVTTTNFNVSPHYNYPVCAPGTFCPNSRTTVSGYDVSETVSVKIHDTSKVAIVLDGLAKAKVTNVSGPEFVVGDTQAAMAEARGKAIAKAQQDAAKLAVQLGVHLGRVVSYNDDNTDSSYAQPMMAKASAAGVSSDSVPPTVPVGQNTYTKNISVTYQIR